MALAGVAIMIVAARPGLAHGCRPPVASNRFSPRGAVPIYPTTLSLAAAGLGAATIHLLVMSGHVVPLVLVQLLPVLATHHITGRSRRAWLT